MVDLDLPSACYRLILTSFSITDPKSAFSYLFILLMLILSAFFAGTETAYSYCNSYRLKVYADDNKKSAKLALKILDKFDDTLIATLIGTNVVHVLLSTIATIICVIMLGDTLGTILATLISTLLVFFFGDMLPKNIAQANPDKWAMHTSYIVYIYMIIIYPLTFIFSMLIKFIKFLFLRKKKNEDDFTEDDFQDVVDKVEQEGVLDEEESDIIQHAVDFGDIKVKKVYTKLEDIIAIDIKNCNSEYLKDFITTHSISRIPVYDGNIDNIIGVLHVRTYLKALSKNKDLKIKDVLLKPYFISPQVKLDDIIDGYRKHHTHIAIIKSKNKVIGIVTMKEVLEELVGEIDEKNTMDTEVDENE